MLISSEWAQNLVAIFWHFFPAPTCRKNGNGKKAISRVFEGLVEFYTATASVFDFLGQGASSRAKAYIQDPHQKRHKHGATVGSSRFENYRKFMWVLPSHVSIWKDSNSNKIHSLKLTASLPLKIGRLTQKERRKSSNHHFSQTKVSGRVLIISS